MSVTPDAATPPAATGAGADPWILLGVPLDASPDDIRAAYARQLEALRAHAATGHPAGAERLAAAHQAYRTLMALAAPASATPIEAALPPLALAVKFQTFLHQDNRFTGKGTVRVEGTRFEVEARLRRPFAFARRRWSFALAEVRNAARDGDLVTFVVVGQGKPWRAVLSFADGLEAGRFFARLPDTRDDGLLTLRDSHKDFQQRLAALDRGTPVTWGLLAANLLLYLVVGLAGGGWITAAPEVLARFGGNLGPLTTDGQWWRLLSATFLHGGLGHLLGNMVALTVFGRLAERIYGSAPFAACYLLCGLVGATATLIFHADAVGVGASGAIFGVIGLLLAFLAADREFLPPSARRQLFINWAIFAGYIFIQGMGKAGTDNAAHGAGLVAGLALGFIVGNPLRRVGGGIPLLSGRMGAGALLCGLAVLAGVLAAPRLEVDYRARRELVDIARRLGEVEKQLGDTGKRLTAPGGGGTPAELLQALRTTQDGYAGLERQVLQVRTQGGEMARRRDLLLRFIRLRQDGLRAIGQGVERDDQALVLAGSAYLKEATALVPKIIQPMKLRP